MKVDATDNVGNTATNSNTFQLHATSLSLLHDVQRACGESGAWPATPTLITKAGVCTSMKAILLQAVTKHASGDHATEQNIVDGWVDDVESQKRQGSRRRDRRPLHRLRQRPDRHRRLADRRRGAAHAAPRASSRPGDF